MIGIPVIAGIRAAVTGIVTGEKLEIYDIKQSFTFMIDCFFLSFDAKNEIKKLEKMVQ